MSIATFCMIATDWDISGISALYRESSPKPEDLIEDMPDVSKGLTEVADVVELAEAGGKAVEGKLEPLLEWVGDWIVGKGIDLLTVLLSHIPNF